MEVILIPLFQVIDIAISLFIWALIISAVLSWLVAFNVVNPHNRLVYTVGDALHRVTEPALRPIRRFLPVAGGVDFSPLVLILLLIFLRGVLHNIAVQIV